MELSLIPHQYLWRQGNQNDVYFVFEEFIRGCAIMAQLFSLPTVTDERGKLTIIEKVFPYDIKRTFFIYDVVEGTVRGGHRHKKNWQALICIKGSCVVKNSDGEKRESFSLDSPDKCLILEPKDWHTMEEFSKGSILMVMASEYYDANDYIDEDYE